MLIEPQNRSTIEVGTHMPGLTCEIVRSASHILKKEDRPMEVTHDQKMKALDDSIEHWADNLAALVKADGMGQVIRTNDLKWLVTTHDGKEKIIGHYSDETCALCIAHGGQGAGCEKCPLGIHGYKCANGHLGIGIPSPWYKVRLTEGKPNHDKIEATREVLDTLIKVRGVEQKEHEEREEHAKKIAECAKKCALECDVCGNEFSGDRTPKITECVRFKPTTDTRTFTLSWDKPMRICAKCVVEIEEEMEGMLMNSCLI